MSLSSLDRLRQVDLIDFLTSRCGTELWTTVHSYLNTPTNQIGFYCALIPSSLVTNVLNSESWDIRIGFGAPGFSSSFVGDSEITTYFHYYDPESIQPLVITREFHGMKPDHDEVMEEFRLFHNLYYDQKKNILLKVDDSGEEEEIVIFGNETKIKTKAIKQFLAAKQMFLAVYCDSVRHSEIELSEIPQNLHKIYDRSDSHTIMCMVSEDNFSHEPCIKTFSRLLGKKLIPPPSQENSGVWPWAKKKKFEDFIIDTDDDGDPVLFSCEPDRLANFFGGNPGAPNFLTPIFFRPEVLKKYYSDSTKYSVEDGYLRCGSLWSMHIDNNHEKYVIVFLGDLGESLSHKEQLYWKSFNVVPDGKISQVNFNRSILGQFADPEKADLDFKYQFRLFQDEFKKKIGWHFFKPLASGDQHLFEALHIPTTDDQGEFDNQILALTKLIIDSLNESEIQKFIIKDGKDIKGISKLEEFLKVKTGENSGDHVKFLRNLQSLRSSSVGHRKGENYQKISQIFGFDEKTSPKVFEEILRRAKEFIVFLRKVLLDEKR